MFRYDQSVRGEESEGARAGGIAPGKRTLTMALPGAVQRKVAVGHGDPDAAAIEAAAARGLGARTAPLPYADAVQASFGRHRVDHVTAHAGDDAAAACADMNAEAYATGDHVVFGGVPTLHTVAHEVAHVVQQRAGVARKGGGGDDRFERHADAVAERVVAGRSAEDLLDELAPPDAAPAPAAAVQRIVKIRGRDPGVANRELIAGHDALRAAHANLALVYHFRDNAHLAAVAGGTAPMPAGVPAEEQKVAAKRKGRDAHVPVDDGGDADLAHAAEKGKKAKSEPEAKLPEEEMPPVPELPPAEAPVDEDDGLDHKHEGGEDGWGEWAEYAGNEAPDVDPDVDPDADPDAEKKDTVVKPPPPMPALSMHLPPARPALTQPLTSGGGALAGLGFHGGPRLELHEKGQTLLARRRSFMRTDSRGQLSYVPADVLDTQREENAANMKATKARVAAKDPNVINISLTITYRDLAGATQSAAGIVPGFWNSGLLQADPASAPAKRELTEEESKKTGAQQRAIHDQRESELARGRLGAYFGARQAEPQDPKLNALPASAGAAMLESKEGALFSHSETMAAADPALPGRLDATIATLLGGKPIAKLVSVTTSIDSFENSVCYNACRPAIAHIETVARARVIAFANTNRIELSARFGGGFRATSVSIYQRAKNPTLRDGAKAAPNSLPLVMAGAPRLEAVPDGAKGNKASKFRTLRREAVAATDILHHERKAFVACVRAWLDTSKGDKLAVLLAGAATPDAAQAVIAKLPGIPPSLRAAVDKVVGRREIDDNALPSLAYLVWDVQQGRGDVGGAAEHKEDPSAGGGGAASEEEEEEEAEAEEEEEPAAAE